MAGKAIIIEGDFSANNIGRVTVITVAKPVIGISITNKVNVPAQLNQAETFQLAIAYNPTDTTQRGVSYSSSNTSLATVSASGLVTAVGNGTATITVRSNYDNSILDTVSILCYKEVAVVVEVTGVAISNKSSVPAQLNEGQTFQIQSAYTPSNTTQLGVSYLSSDTSIATVSAGGLVTAFGNGTATITMKSSVNQALTDSVDILCYKEEVIPVPITGVSITNKASVPVQLNENETFQLTYAYAPVDTTDIGVSFISSDTSIATVSSSGLVTAVGNGTATITIQSTVNTSLSDTVDISCYKAVGALWTAYLLPSGGALGTGVTSSYIDSVSSKTINPNIGNDTRNSITIYSDNGAILTPNRMTRSEVAAYLTPIYSGYAISIPSTSTYYPATGLTIPFAYETYKLPLSVGKYGDYLLVVNGIGLKNVPSGTYKAKVLSTLSGRTKDGYVSSELGILKINGVTQSLPSLSFENNETWMEIDINIGSEGYFVISLENTNSFNNNYSYFCINMIELTRMS